MKWLLLISLTICQVNAQIFKVHGGLEAGTNAEFTIVPEVLEERVDYELEDVREAIKKVPIILNENAQDARQNAAERVAEKKKTVSGGNSDFALRSSSPSENPDAFRYNHMMPKDTNTTQIFLPSGSNTMIMDDETGNFTTFDGLFVKKLVPLLEDLTYLKNAVKILGALLGLDMAQLEVPLIGEKEAYILLERVKNGDIPIFVPGDLFVDNILETGMDEEEKLPQYCSAFRGNYSTAGWIRNNLWQNMTTSDLSHTVDVSASERWDIVNDTTHVRNKATNKTEWNYTVFDDERDVVMNNEIKSKVCV